MLSLRELLAYGKVTTIPHPIDIYSHPIDKSNHFGLGILILCTGFHGGGPTGQWGRVRPAGGIRQVDDILRRESNRKFRVLQIAL